MKKLFFILLAVSSVAFTACSDNDDNEDVYYSIGTVSVDDDSNINAINSDLGNVINANNTPRTDLDNGARAYVQYINLENVAGEESNVYSADFIYIDGILTKNIVEVNPENADSIGNDPINLSEVWFSDGYLNVEFSFLGDYQMHFINMVGDSALFASGGTTEPRGVPDTIYLELRHNAYDDFDRAVMSGLASFRLESLPFYVKTGQIFSVSYKDLDGIIRTKDIEYKLSSKEERMTTGSKNKNRDKIK
ncbi:MAG: hypothetical protein ACK5MG_06405 [Bacteroidales bacterium]